ncbi:MAG: hypothetical protein NT071_05910, partial [Burkholderiales bacterium]|nr:hypothetical protein [Burkholderiales bacterium]
MHHSTTDFFAFAGAAGAIFTAIGQAEFGTSDDESNLINGSVVFFAIATILLVLGVIAIPLMFKDPYFLLNVYKSGEISEEVIKEICEEYELDSNEYL